MPGTASYSAYMPMIGPSPFDQSAAKAVGIPPEPCSTVKPSARRRSAYQAADLYSRQAGSAKSKTMLHSLGPSPLAYLPMRALCGTSWMQPGVAFQENLLGIVSRELLKKIVKRYPASLQFAPSALKQGPELLKASGLWTDA